MSVFENESAPMQNASYREHLDRNWNNGNKALNELNSKINEYLEEKDEQGKHILELETRIEKLEKIAMEYDKLNNAVFGGGTDINISDMKEVNNSVDVNRKEVENDINIKQ